MATQMTNVWTAIYKNAAGVEVEVPVVENGSGFLLETETGQLQPYTTVLQDARLGELKHVRTERIPEQVPLPSDPIRDGARAELHQKLGRFPSEHLANFLNGQNALKKALDRKDNFAAASLAALIRWSTAIDAEIERLAAARKAATPPPVFDKFHLTRSFRGKYYGDLFIEKSREDGCTENGWNATWWARCSKCEKDGPSPRYVTAQTILEWECGYREKFVCQQPCRG